MFNRSEVQFMIEINPVTREFRDGRPVPRLDETGRPAAIFIQARTWGRENGRPVVRPVGNR
jgi:hypothetical protein